MAGFKDVLKHSGYYLIANLATRALSFISIPIYTRLLSTDEYGTYSVFLSVSGILSSIFTLCVDQSISRYYFDQKSADDFRRFTSTSSILALTVFIINGSLFFLFAGDFAKLVGLSKTIVYLMIPISLVNIIGLTFEQIYGPLKKSKIIALSSLLRVYIGFAFSISLAFFFKTDKYFGILIGQIIAGFIMIFYWVKLIIPYFKLSFDKFYLKYIFKYSVPLIPYALSGVVIEQFGKIAIGNSLNISQAGFYSLALLISSLVSIAISVTHQAWVPYYMEYMNSKNYSQYDTDQIKIFKITVLVAIVVAAFGNNIGALVTTKGFSGSFYLIPVFTIGYVFYQLAYVYMRNFAYSKKTQYLTLTVLLSGLSNIIFNINFIYRFGELGAALSFVLSYIIMAFFAWFFNKYFVKNYCTPLYNLLLPFIISIPFYVVIFFIPSINSFILSIFVKIIIVIMVILLLFWRDKNNIYQQIILRYKQ